MTSSVANQSLRIRTEDAFELCRHLEPTSAISSFLTPNITTSLLIQSLINHDHWFDAATVLAHSLQTRPALWWACLACKDHAAIKPASATPPTLLTMIESWIKNPTEEFRLGVFHQANIAGNRSPGYWAGMATFWSMGNITPGSGIETPPPPFMYAKAVAACIDLSAALALGERENFYKNIMTRGLDLASGGNGMKNTDERVLFNQ